MIQNNNIEMKKIFKYVLVCAVAITGITSVSSCSNDDDEDEKTEVVELRSKLNGKWTLVKYNEGNNTWGEFMEIKGDSMIWNSRQQGVDSKYKLKFEAGSSFSAECVWASDSDYFDNNWKFNITMCTSDTLKTVDNKGDNTRVFARVYSK